METTPTPQKEASKPHAKEKPRSIRFGVLEPVVKKVADDMNRSVNWYVNQLVKKDLKERNRI